MNDLPSNHQNPTSASAAPAAREPGPVFIVGSPRSGTTILAEALSRGAGYRGAAEGHLLPLLGRLQHVTTDYYETRPDIAGSPDYLLGRVSLGEVNRRLAQLFQELYRNQYDGAWYDKTVGCDMLRVCPTVLELWPDARIVFARRRGVENVLSRLRKYPLRSFEDHCTDWAAASLQWLRTRPLLGDRWIEIDQRDIALDGLGTAERLRAFLGLDRARGRAMAEVFAGRRPEQTAPPGDARAVALAATGWSDEWIEHFHRTCGDAMRAFGYGSDRYYLPDGPERSAAPPPLGSAAEALAEYGAYHGHVDHCDGAVVEGWAMNRLRPEERVALEVHLDGIRLGHGLAEVYRQDLHAAGIGDGKHGFRIALSPQVPTTSLRDVRVRIAATAQLLQPGP